METPITDTVPPTLNVGHFLTSHPAWNMDMDTDQEDPCTEYLNADGSLTDAAYDFLHHEWATGRLI